VQDCFREILLSGKFIRGGLSYILKIFYPELISRNHAKNSVPVFYVLYVCKLSSTLIKMYFFRPSIIWQQDNSAAGSSEMIKCLNKSSV
jgi:hypothetical protein